jgi:hypothetical protein
MVTASEDKTLFFFGMELQTSHFGQATPFTRYSVVVKPIGFIILQCAATSIALSIEDNLTKNPFNFQTEKGNKTIGLRMLINLTDGNLLTGLLPNDLTLDNTSTFEIPFSKLAIKPWTYDIKEIPVYEPEFKSDARPDSTGSKGKEETELKHTKEIALSLNSLRKADGLQLQSHSKVTTVSFLRQGYFLAAVINKKEECEVRICHVLAPTFSKLISIGTAPVTKLLLNRSGRYILAGSTDGATSFIKFNMPEFLGPRPENEHETYLSYVNKFNERVDNYHKTLQTLKEQISDNSSNGAIVATRAALTSQQWSGHVHDLVSGKISNLQTSFDDSFVISAGSDGGLFVWRIIPEPQKENPELNDDLSEQSNTFNCPDDITDLNTYSIQESKMKAEKDRELAQAEERKQLVRNSVQELRNEFLALMAENDKLPVEKKAPRSLLSVDPYLERDIEMEKKEKITNLRKELAWITEKEAIGPRKLKQKFLDPLQQEGIKIKGLKVLITKQDQKDSVYI